MSGPSYVRVYPTDWRSGCLGLSLEQEGLYIRICMFIAETGRRVPLDDTEASRMMGTQTRNYRRVLGELLRLGKLKRHENGYGNDRIEHERSRSQNGIKQASDTEHSAAPTVGTDRKTDQGQQRENTTPAIANDDVSPIYSRSTPVITELAGEKAEQNQQPSIEPEPEPKNNKKTIACDPDGVRMADGKITLDASNWEFWLPHFNGDSEALSLALMQAAGFIQVNDRSKPLAAKVGAQLAMMARNKRERDSRYQSAKEANRSTPSTSGRPGWVVEKERKSAAAKAAMEEVLASLSSGVSNVG